ncbi:MAG TPA: hypothetical protein VI076_13660, partial [Actinopolymorphaceae bacterium]
FAISPTLIAGIAVVQETVPAGRLSEGMSWVTSGLVAGVALGAALTGQVIDVAGASAAFWVAVGAGAVAAAASLAGGRGTGDRRGHGGHSGRSGRRQGGSQETLEDVTGPATWPSDRSLPINTAE